MKSDKNHLNLFEKKDTKIGIFEKPYTSFLAIILGIVSVFISLSIGFFAYKYTLKTTEERYHKFYMNKAKMLASIADSHKDTAKDILLNIIEASWRASGDKPPDEYLCVVDKDANLILHTAHPDIIGKYVGNNLVPDNQPPQPCSLQEIIQSQVDYVGNYIANSGQKQIAAFAAIPQRQWILGIHRSKDALIKGIKDDVFFFALGYIIACGFFLPVSLVLLYVTFKASNRKRMNVEEKLRLLNKDLEQRIVERTTKLLQINEKLTNESNERVRAEEDLRKIFDLSIDMICIADITNGYFKKINPSFGRTLGYSDEELLGKPFLDFIHKDDMKPTLDVIEKKLLQGIEVFNFENRYRCKDGSYKWIMWSSRTISELGKTYAVGRDITEKKLVEDELKLLNETLEQRVAKRTAELAKANEELVKMQKLESVGVLAGGIAHDFNNNLQSILSCVTLAKTYANPEDEVYERLTDAERITLQAKGLSQQLLTFSRGGDPIRKTIFIPELIKNSVNLALSGSNVKCELDIPNDLWPVEADKGQLGQVISNLIINADQAMPEGGIVKVKSENINVGKNDLLSLKEGKYVRITIEDQGCGISHEHLQKIFDPYFTTKQKGSGLGLATCYSIIKKHDGYIDVESEVGVGTSFHIYLPASRIETLKKPIPSEAERVRPELIGENGASSMLKGKVLLMDDEAIIRLSIARHLEKRNYEVEMAKSGTEAIELYKKALGTGKSFDAVVMDLTIPGDMGGKEATEKLLELDPKTKVIVASGYVDDPIMAEFEKHGFKGVLTKPYEVDELDEMLQKVIIEKGT